MVYIPMDPLFKIHVFKYIYQIPLIISSSNQNIGRKLRVSLVEGVQSWMIENEERIEKWENRRDFKFSRMCF